jgi:hypothetical protein
MPRGYKYDNGKRKPMIQIIGKKARKLSKKRENSTKLQEAPKRTSQKEGFQNLNFTGISVQQRMTLFHGRAI